MLRFHFVNVGQGSSTIVEFEEHGRRHFGIIDSNCRRAGSNEALEKLSSLGADCLSFVMLTHPHADHYGGMSEILTAYQGKIGSFFVFDVGSLIRNPSKRKRLYEGYRRLIERSDDQVIRSRIFEMVSIIRWMDENPGVVTPCGGEHYQVAPEGFAGVKVHTILPQRSAKGNYLDAIQSGDLSVHGSLRENALSIAVLFEYAGVRVLIGGDAIEGNWSKRLRWVDAGGESAAARIVNLPHHGSKYENTPSFLEGYFAPVEGLYAIVSADGQKHPDQEVIEELERRSIAPYCTNLMPVCGANVQEFRGLQDVSPQLAKFIRQTAEPRYLPQACQGTIALAIGSDGQVTVDPEFRAPCSFRGDYERLLA